MCMQVYLSQGTGVAKRCNMFQSAEGNDLHNFSQDCNYGGIDLYLWEMLQIEKVIKSGRLNQ